jgi:hypothetical protein
MPRRPVVAVWLFVALLLCPLSLLRARGADHAAPPAGVATSYPAFDQHPAEQVAIAADPYNTQEKASIFRFKYLQYGFMPIRIIVTNNGDKPISLIDARINFITAFGDKIPAAEPEEVERRIGGIKRPDGGYKLPGPLPRIGNSRGAHHAGRLPFLRCGGAGQPTGGRQTQPPHAAQRGWQGTLLLRDPLRQVPDLGWEIAGITRNRLPWSCLFPRWCSL